MWPEGIIKLKKNSFIYKLLEFIELKYYKSASGIVTVTKNFKIDIIKRTNLSSNKFSVIYNGSNNQKFKIKRANTDILKTRLKIKEKFIVGYAGTFGVSHSLDFILSCCNEIYKKRKIFIFY